MSSTEPPSRISHKQSHETKSAQDDLSSKGKVEKVREIDADEQTRQKKKFRMMMGDEDQVTEPETERPPTPFEIFSPKPSLGDDTDDSIIPSPPYSPPPDVSVSAPAPEDDDATVGALPHSDEFWDDVNLPPDQPLKPQQYTEKPLKKTEKKEEKKEPALFGPPGKPTTVGKATPPKKGEKKKELPSPFEEAAKIAKPQKPEKKEEAPVSTTRYFAVEEKGEKKPRKKEDERTGIVIKEPDVIPFRTEDREEGRGQQGRGQRIVEIEAPSLPLLPSGVQPMAFAAATAAQPYLSPQTMSLFFQMVGQIYVMVAPPGISTTEIVLNNPAYANSRFFGAIITIEKYATAPDSFNIRLTGSDKAVASFRENIPSLMNAFQNSNLPFKVHRIDAEYSTEKPVFRRKEKGEGRSETGGGDLGEKKR